MSKSSLTYIYNKFYRESSFLLNSCIDSLLYIHAHPGKERLFTMSAEMAVIRLHDEWSKFCRELVILSAGYRPYTANSIRLSLAPSVKKPSDVIPKLLSTYKKRKYEPKWYDAVECIDAANRIKVQNLSTIAVALGSSNSPAEEVRIIRNYFAHRNNYSAEIIRNHSSLKTIKNLDIESIAGEKLYPGILRIEYWVSELKLIAKAAIQ